MPFADSGSCDFVSEQRAVQYQRGSYSKAAGCSARSACSLLKPSSSFCSATMCRGGSLKMTSPCRKALQDVRIRPFSGVQEHATLPPCLSSQ